MIEYELYARCTDCEKSWKGSENQVKRKVSQHSALYGCVTQQSRQPFPENRTPQTQLERLEARKEPEAKTCFCGQTFEKSSSLIEHLEIEHRGSDL